MSPLFPTSPDRQVAMRPRLVLAALLMATGASLVIYVLGRMTSLLLVLSVVVPSALLFATVMITRLPGQARAAVAARARAGLLAGAVATAAYDASRWVTATTAAANLNPFAAWPIFGRAIAGAGTSPTQALAIGVIYHLVNGLSFATAYAVLLPRGGVLAGIAWGMVLETAMLSVYPGWLDIRALREFATVSVVGHLCYGSTLGLLVPRLLDRSAARVRRRLTGREPR